MCSDVGQMLYKCNQGCHDLNHLWHSATVFSCKTRKQNRLCKFKQSSPHFWRWDAYWESTSIFGVPKFSLLVGTVFCIQPVYVVHCMFYFKRCVLHAFHIFAFPKISNNWEWRWVSMACFPLLCPGLLFVFFCFSAKCDSARLLLPRGLLFWSLGCISFVESGTMILAGLHFFCWMAKMFAGAVLKSDLKSDDFDDVDGRWRRWRNRARQGSTPLH